MPKVSVVIPTNRPPAVLEPCLQALARQRFPASEVEVLAIYNGVESVPSWPANAWPFELVVGHIDQANIAAAKNVALDRARGEIVLLLNDDVLPEPDFVERHVAAHRNLDRPAMVLGKSAWRRLDGETVFDRLIHTTSMIFFYDQMQPHAWYNYRHAWNLNLSLPRRLVETLRFGEDLGPFFFEDLELAYRLEQAYDARVWYEADAVALHDHRYTFAGYLQRERELGRAALRLWTCNPECFRATYGSDLDDAYVDYLRQYVQMEGRREEQMREQLDALFSRAADALPTAPDVCAEVINALYLAHLPLKRLAFRQGLLFAVEAHAAAVC